MNDLLFSTGRIPSLSFNANKVYPSLSDKKKKTIAKAFAGCAAMIF
jgi:hypothetical protein